MEKNKYYYKVVAKLFGHFYSIYDGQLEFELGQTYYQEAQPNHQGGFYVYEDLNKAIFTKMLKFIISYVFQRPKSKDGLFIAPRTILKVICSGPQIAYQNGKIAFSFICPIEDIGMPKGYKLMDESKKLAIKWCEKKQQLKRIKNIQKKQLKED